MPLEMLIHDDKYDMGKHLKGEDIMPYLDKIRALGRPGYRVILGEDQG